MKISFCITCMGRLHHLKETLQKNIEDNADYENIEFLILDYNSPDGLEAWVENNISTLQNIAYFRERSAVRWRMPHAKNMAHLLATGEIVCNLDADNFTGKSYALKLAEHFSAPTPKIVTHVLGGGFGGRIAIRKSDFLALRGYDEALGWGWGCEDDDFKGRAAAAGLTTEQLWIPGDWAIVHENSERIRYMPEWTHLEEAHSRQVEVFQKRASGGIINQEGYGKGVIYRGFETEPFPIGVEKFP